MSKKLILILIVGVLFFNFSLARANVIINEIMYAPANEDSEWIEIFNSGDGSIDLSDWRFFNNKDDSAPLRLQKGSAVLSPGGYAIITTLSDSISFPGVVFSSSQFSLPNDSSKYNTYKAISNSAKENIDFVTYVTSSEALGTGNSLQLINGEWKIAVRTSGTKNQISVNTLEIPATLAVTNNQTTTSTETKTIEVPKIKTKITAKTLGFVGLPLSLEATTFGYGGEELHYGKYFWNFGDASSKEIKLSDNQPFTHTYFYPGDYAVSLDYYRNYYSNVPDISEIITVKIVPVDISISRVGDEKDFFVELFNDTDYNVDISNWTLSSSQKSFTMPQNTILASKKKMIISPKITNFSIADKNALKLMTPQGNTIFSYSFLVEPVEVLVKNISPTNLLISENKNKKKNTTNFAIAENIVENLPALASRSDVVKQDSNFSPIIPIVTFFFIGASAGGVYFIRRKKVVTQPGNDFEILDE